MSTGGEGGSVVNNFEQVSSDGHQISLVGGPHTARSYVQRGRGGSQARVGFLYIPCAGGGGGYALRCNASPCEQTGVTENIVFPQLCNYYKRRSTQQKYAYRFGENCCCWSDGVSDLRNNSRSFPEKYKTTQLLFKIICIKYTHLSLPTPCGNCVLCLITYFVLFVFARHSKDTRFICAKSNLAW